MCACVCVVTQGSWGTSNEDEKEELTAAQQFEAAAEEVNAKVSLVAKTYEVRWPHC